MNRTSEFKNILNNGKTNYFMEAHNAISGLISKECGFSGIWGSGLTISASMGFRDNNEISPLEVVNIMEHLYDRTNLPIILDADTGYGNFNNARLLVRKLEKIGVAAVSIEDKIFPKTNSFIDSEKQTLVAVDEFCGKIKAMKNFQKDSDFCVIARTEALITGLGMEEALRRANAYYEAGADAIFIHSKKEDGKEIIEFLEKWNNRCPVIIAPTTYYKTNMKKFEDLGVSIILWANIMLRASITAMEKVARRVSEDKSIESIVDKIAPIKEIFRLQDVDELKKAERLYL